jgi:inosine-uridine nucleoside N-ribohydrolase
MTCATWLVLGPMVMLALAAAPGAPAQQRPRLVIDADTGNEIDDLFAITRLLRQDRYEVVGVCSAQWFHAHSGPRTVHASQRLNEDLLRLHGREGVPALLGAEVEFGMPWGGDDPRDSAAARFLIERARAVPEGERLTVVCLGATTNLASAIKLAPDIAARIEAHVIGFKYDVAGGVWNKSEFNVRRDLNAADFLLDCGALELRVMPANVAEAMRFDRDEAFERLGAMGEVGEYLADRWRARAPHEATWTMWDVALAEALVHPEWAPRRRVATPPENRRREMWVYETIDAGRMREDFWGAVTGR